MNEFQVRKQQKQQSMATKVTDQRLDENAPQSSAMLSFDEKCISFINSGRELIAQNPHITTE